MSEFETQPKNFYRPSSLAEVAEWSLQNGNFDYHLRDFLHEFARRKDFAMLEREPILLIEHFTDDGVRDAYLAATAAYLAREIKREVPHWAFNENRFAQRPMFAAAQHTTLRLMLLHESPPEFRERNLFVSANALTVC